MKSFPPTCGNSFSSCLKPWSYLPCRIPGKLRGSLPHCLCPSFFWPSWSGTLGSRWFHYLEWVINEAHFISKKKKKKAITLKQSEISRHNKTKQLADENHLSKNIHSVLQSALKAGTLLPVMNTATAGRGGGGGKVRVASSDGALGRCCVSYTQQNMVAGGWGARPGIHNVESKYTAQPG